jgi:hypothetical protein
MGAHFDLLREDRVPCIHPTGLRHRGILAALRDAA